MQSKKLDSLQKAFVWNLAPEVSNRQQRCLNAKSFPPWKYYVYDYAYQASMKLLIYMLWA